MATLPSRQSRKWLIVWVAYWIALFGIMHTPRPPGINLSIEGSDKIIHFFAYGLLSWLGGRTLHTRAERLPTSLLLRWMIVYMIYAVFDEWLQQFVNRTTSVGDWVADSLGVLTVTLLLLWQNARRKPPEHPESGGPAPGL